jgi:hypothetical protein
MEKLKNWKIFSVAFIMMFSLLPHSSLGKVKKSKKSPQKSESESPNIVINDLDFEFKDHRVYIKIKKAKDTFEITDELGTRALQIKNCNKKIIHEFSEDILTHIKGLQTSQSSNKKNPDRWVKFEGIQYPVLTFEPAFKFFHETSHRSHALFMESHRLCKN